MVAYSIMYPLCLAYSTNIAELNKQILNKDI